MKKNKQLSFPTEGDLQGDRRDDPHGGQERGREDQLQRVPGDDGGSSSPSYIAIRSSVKAVMAMMVMIMIMTVGSV